MANTKVFTIKVNGIDELKSLDQVVQLTSNSLGELQAKKEAVEQAFKQSDFGTNEFRVLQSELQKVNTSLKVIDESTSDLTISEKFEGFNRVIGAVGSSFAFATISAQAFGDANGQTAEELQKLETQVTAVIQGTQTFQALTDTFSSKNKLFLSTINAVSKGFNALGISAKGSGLAIRGALIATGIGVLIVGITTLIQNFDELKALAQPLIQAFQPFFNGVRDFASLLTGGLIDNSALANTKDFVNKLNTDLTKSQEVYSEKLNKIRSESTKTTEQELAKQRKIIEETVKNQEDLYKKAATLRDTFLSQTQKKRVDNINRINDLENKTIAGVTGIGRGNIDKEIKALNEQNKAYDEQDKFVRKITQSIGNKNVTEQDTTDFSKFILNLKGQELVVSKELLGISKKQFGEQKLTTEQIKEKADIQRKLDEENINNALKLRTIQNQIDSEREKRSQTNNDLLKTGIDLILSYGNSVNTLNKNFPVFDNLGRQLAIINNELDGNFKNIFSGLFSGNEAVSVDNLTNALKAYGAEQERLINFNNDKGVSSIKAQIKANEDLIEVYKDEPKRQAELRKTNLLLDQNIKGLNDSARKQIIELQVSIDQLVTSLPNAIGKLNLKEFQGTLENSSSAFEKFKQGLFLNDTEKALIQETFGVTIQEIKTGYNSLTEAQQNFVDNRGSEQLIKSIENERNSFAQLATTFPELKEGLEAYDKQLSALQTTLQTNKKNQKDNIENLKLELKLLQDTAKINSLQKNLNKDFISPEKNIANIKEVSKIQLENTNLVFEQQTKNISKLSLEYAKLDEKRIQDIEAIYANENKLIDEQIQMTIDKYSNLTSTVLNGIGAVSEAIFNGLQNRNNALIQSNSLAIDRLNEEIQGFQEQINFIDNIINEKKKILDDLQNAAQDSVGGQREEILKQLDAESAKTKVLIKNKKDLQTQEAKAAKEAAKLAKDNQRIQLENIVLAQQQAVAANVLAIAQTGLAIAQIAVASSRIDFTFGIATVASIVAVAGALAVNIASTASALNSLDSAKEDLKNFKAEGGYTGVGGKVDQTGERSVGTYVLHEREWIAPRWMTESPKYSGIINDLEKTRQRGFAEGGSPTPITINNNNDVLTNLLIANLNKPVYVSVVDINNGQQRVNVIQSRAKL